MIRKQASMPTRALTFTSVLLISGLLVGCGRDASPGAQRTSDESRPVVVDDMIVPDGIDRVPAATIQDVAGFADAVAVVKVTSEKVQDVKQQLGETNEGLLARELTLTVESTPWVRSGKKVPNEVTLGIPAYKVNGDRWTPMSDTGGLRMEEGSSYVAFLTEFPDNGWKLLSGASFYPLTNGKVQSIAVENSLGKTFVGKTPEEIARVVSTTEPRAEVAKVLSLDPDARNQAAADTVGG